MHAALGASPDLAGDPRQPAVRLRHRLAPPNHGAYRRSPHVISRGYATGTAEVAEARRRPPLDTAGRRASDAAAVIVVRPAAADGPPMVGRRSRDCVALYRDVPELDTVFILALRHQRAGYRGR
jgi:hypothetical protein